MPSAFALILDDRERAQPPASHLVGERPFGDVVFRRNTVASRIADAIAGAGGTTFWKARSDGEYAWAMREASTTCEWAAVWRASAVSADRPRLADLLERVRLAQCPVVLEVDRAVALVSTMERLRALGPNPWAHDLRAQGWNHLDVRDSVTDLADYRQALRFLSGGFDARHFNVVQADETTVTKRSRDRDKIRGEHDYYYHLPPELRRWFVQPRGLSVDGEWASYQMDRLYVPDAALQWVHGALGPADFETLMSLAFTYLDARPTRRVSPAAAAAAVDALYLTKVRERMRALNDDPRAARLRTLIAAATTAPSLDDVVARFDDLYQRHRGALVAEPMQAVGHGDFCFSNMLLQRDPPALRLIDPRGARIADEMWMAAGYDIAKLAHSVLGDYDWIACGRYRVEADAMGMLQLEILNADASLDAMKQAFVTRLEARGIDLRVVRTCEVSLFLSMLPLHLEQPGKVLALLMNAIRIMDELDENG